jgi:sugar phosphate permease
MSRGMYKQNSCMHNKKEDYFQPLFINTIMLNHNITFKSLSMVFIYQTRFGSYTWFNVI